MKDFRFYKGISQESINKAFEEIKQEGHLVENIHFRDLDDQFIVFYNTIPKTKPTEEDLRKDVHTDVPPFDNRLSNPSPTLQDYAKEYWYVLAIGGAFLFYWFFIYK